MWKRQLGHNCDSLDSYKDRTHVWESYPLETTRTLVSNEVLCSVLSDPCGHPVTLLFSRSVASNSLQPHGLQHTRLPCPPLSPGVYSSSVTPWGLIMSVLEL